MGAPVTWDYTSKHDRLFVCLFGGFCVCVIPPPPPPLQDMMLAPISFVLKIFSLNFLSFHDSNVVSYQLCVISMHITRLMVPLIPCPLSRCPACVFWEHQLLFSKVTVVLPTLQQQEVLVRNIAFRGKGFFCTPKVK